MKYRIIVYDWNPNGTNDIAIDGSYGDGDPRCMDCLEEALFGIDVTKLQPVSGDRHQGMDGYNQGYWLSLDKALSHIAVSPVEDGQTTIKFLSKYFKTVKGVAS